MNDIVIRKLAVLSQLAVFKDIIPGYRIRALTDAEKAEKVSQPVARTREWEQGLVVVYQTYIRSLESEIKGMTQNFVVISLTDHQRGYQPRLVWRKFPCDVHAHSQLRPLTSILVPTS
jgi:Nucleolar complex-associated protein